MHTNDALHIHRVGQSFMLPVAAPDHPPRLHSKAALYP